MGIRPGAAPSYEQTELALRSTLFRVSVRGYDRLISDHGISGTGVFIELAAEPDKIPFYEKLGFDTDESQRPKMMYRVK